MLNVWQVGEAKITRVVEGGDFPIDPALLFATDRHAVKQDGARWRFAVDPPTAPSGAATATI